MVSVTGGVRHGAILLLVFAALLLPRHKGVVGFTISSSSRYRPRRTTMTTTTRQTRIIANNNGRRSGGDGIATSTSRSVSRTTIVDKRGPVVIDDDDDDVETTAARTFDPLELSGITMSGEVGPVTDNNGGSEEQQQEIGIWGARLILLLVAAIWGTNFASVKYLSSLCFEPPCVHFPSEAAFARFGLAAAVSLPLLYGQRRDVIAAGLECGAWISMGYATQAMALATISSGKCAFICSLTVVVVPILSALVYGKPIRAMNFVAAAVALSGVGILEGMIDVNDLFAVKAAFAETTTVGGGGVDTAAAVVGATSSALSSSTVETSSAVTAAAAAGGPLASVAHSLGISKGDILALGQPLGFGCCFTRIEHYQEKFKDVPGRVLTIAAAQCVAVGLLSLLWVLHDYNWTTFPDFGYMMDWHRLVAVGWTGIVTTVFAIFLEGIALQTATATDAAITFSSEPVWASLFGFLLLHEQLSMKSYVGGAVILVACLLGSLSDMHQLDDNKLDTETIEEDADVATGAADVVKSVTSNERHHP